MFATLSLQAPPPVALAPGPVRPYAVVGAGLLSASSTVAGGKGLPVYNPVTQTAAYRDGTPLTAMATTVKTNPDGDPGNPPPHDEGADPGFC